MFVASEIVVKIMMYLLNIPQSVAGQL